MSPRKAASCGRGPGTFMRIGQQSSQADQRVPRLAQGCDPTALALSPSEGYLLSRIDGATSWGVLRQMGGLPAPDVDRCLERWLKDGVIEVDGPDAGGAGARAGTPDAGDAQRAEADADATSAGGAAPDDAGSEAAPAAVDGVEVDASLALDVDVQRRILAFAARLDRPYHEILGVARDADGRAIKKAYFALSKVLHPDRYFRRDIGAFEPLVERCFKKLLEAYELLSDPATRAEVQREAEAGAAGTAGDAAEASATETPAFSGPPPSARDAARRLRLRALRRAGGAAGLAERRRKAKSFFEAGMAAFAAERWLEAAGAVRLAIAFDPANDAFRERFVEVQRRAHEERAAQLVAQADRALEFKTPRDALPLLEEAAGLRPADAELHFRAAKLAWQLAGGDVEALKGARRLAANACEIEPERADMRLLLGRIYKAAGLTANARRELEAALSLEPRSAEAKAELKSL